MKRFSTFGAAALTLAIWSQAATAQVLDEQAVAAAPPSSITFNLLPNPAVLNCLAISPDKTPKATATVVRGALNDTMTLAIENIKPNLAFDVFTVQRSPFLEDGEKNPKFHGSFGQAWYQSDLEANGTGKGSIMIKTILLDQIFGFNPDFAMPPLNTFHVGFWFNNPQDAAACGFDVTHPTPFNGEHRAGPVAMISGVRQQTGFGPLCTSIDPNTKQCNP